MVEGQLNVAQQGSLALMQVVGRGTLKLADGFSKWIDSLVAQEGLSGVMLDLASCTGLDSTFMGLMVSLARKSQKRFALLVVNASEAHRRLLDDIGVTRVWKYVEQPVPELAWTSLAEAAAGSTALSEAMRKLIIDAHEQLMALKEENVPRFRDVVEMLKE